ncbi:hypothetical protein HMPREF2604_07395 [Corynebacterium sp. HMSC055A01]|uniref:hypothetical protein n=1 Tax=Corynebacterium sp. HMSC055A01 TaxID=1715083 RepID=UPI0008A1FF4C|nr:hypothetical protein [Corynebacterium sp. HMSC055A01]OFN17757.1 hypothetical protein HMPREF2604_07395 [Corynebacterium sp. HMSC055A01]
MTNPTRQEIIDAYDALEILYDLVEVLSFTDSETHLARKHCATVLAALPPKPRPTMVEIEWDDDKHYMAEAEHVHDYTVIMLKPMRSEPRIKCLAFHDGDFCIVYSDPEDLTPTGKRYTLTEVQE